MFIRSLPAVVTVTALRLVISISSSTLRLLFAEKEPLLLFAVTVITVVPVFLAVTAPESDTLATEASELSQVSV